MKQLNELQLEGLIDLVKSLAWNDGFGCYTRTGFEKLIWPEIAAKARWIIFFDIDHMHALNERHGHAGVDAIIRKSLAMREGDYVAGQHYSGDEFIICVTDAPLREPSDPLQLCERLRSIFEANGAPATFAVAPVTSASLKENVDPALRLVEKAKSEDRRGQIYSV